MNDLFPVTFIISTISKAEREAEPDWFKRPDCCAHPNAAMCSDCHKTNPPCLELLEAENDRRNETS